jgi:predicted lipoprotein with Yx(FWY)xxD motif
MVKNPLILGCFAATVVVLAGCGSSSSTTSSSASAPAAAATTAAATTPAAGTPASSGGDELIATKHSKLGTVLTAGPKKLTVYLFEADKSGKSACSGACVSVWPPVTTSGAAKAGGSAVAADLGTTMRSDGTEQVTYKGHPLYFYVKDKDDGDAYGQGSTSFGAGWYVMKPSGAKIDDDDDSSDKGGSDDS